MIPHGLTERNGGALNVIFDKLYGADAKKHQGNGG